MESIRTLRDNLVFETILDFFGIDRTVGFATMIRLWSLVTGPITLLLIASKFTAELQGYYYTFINLLGLTAFVELGLSIVIQQFASHEWANLKLNAAGEIEGEISSFSRLSHLSRIAFRWYGTAGIVAFVSLSIAGTYFFSQENTQNIQWLSPWIFQCFITGISIFLIAAWTLLDGCYQMHKTLVARFFIAVVNSIVMWSSIFLGAKLWTVPIVGLVNICLSIFFIGFTYKKFFFSLINLSISKDKINWKEELWPMQWKVALSWISNYFIFSFFTPLVFKLRGPIEAGQMGMTLTGINTLLLVSHGWVSTKAPKFGVLVSKGEFKQLDSLFKKALSQNLLIGLIGTIVIWSGIAFLNVIDHPLASRFLNPKVVLVLLMATLINMIVHALGVYLRSHKKEPFLVPLVLTSIMVGGFSVLLGSKFGLMGVAVGYLLTMFLVIFPEILIFFRCRSSWHTSFENAR
jgi:hypothetical protein